MLTFGSLFSGAGGMDRGLEMAGLTCAWQCEIDKTAVAVLERHWPGKLRFGDVREIPSTVPWVHVLAGGDPCPKHSRARSNGASRHPDLAGYFLALVGRLRPEWVVRENVPAPTVGHFDAALAALGYGTVVIRMDAAPVTGQSRKRDFVVGRLDSESEWVAAAFYDSKSGSWSYPQIEQTPQVANCLTCHRTRYEASDNFVWEPAFGLRVLDAEERERLAGFPAGWTDGFSEAARARLYGNSLVPSCAKWLGERIMQAERNLAQGGLGGG